MQRRRDRSGSSGYPRTAPPGAGFAPGGARGHARAAARRNRGSCGAGPHRGHLRGLVDRRGVLRDTHCRPAGHGGAHAAARAHLRPPQRRLARRCRLGDRGRLGHPPLREHLGPGRRGARGAQRRAGPLLPGRQQAAAHGRHVRPGRLRVPDGARDLRAHPCLRRRGQRAGAVHGRAQGRPRPRVRCHGGLAHRVAGPAHGARVGAEPHPRPGRQRHPVRVHRGCRQRQLPPRARALRRQRLPGRGSAVRVAPHLRGAARRRDRQPLLGRQPRQGSHAARPHRGAARGRAGTALRTDARAVALCRRPQPARLGAGVRWRRVPAAHRVRLPGRHARTQRRTRHDGRDSGDRPASAARRQRRRPRRPRLSLERHLGRGHLDGDAGRSRRLRGAGLHRHYQHRVRRRHPDRLRRGRPRRPAGAVRVRSLVGDARARRRPHRARAPPSPRPAPA